MSANEANLIAHITVHDAPHQRHASNIVQTADAELVPLVAYVGSLPDPFTYTTDGRIAIG